MITFTYTVKLFQVASSIPVCQMVAHSHPTVIYDQKGLTSPTNH